MKKVFSILAMFAVALATGFFSADKAEAVPAFARQMQMSCKSCHFQHFPKLNAFGRAFKANGYTDVAVDTINGDWGTSLPVNLNMSWVTKIRYNKNVSRDNCSDDAYTDGIGGGAGAGCQGAERGELVILDEGVFFIGGRVAEHIGAAVEVAGGAWANGTIVFGHELESLHTHLGLAVWSTDGAGPFWGKEIFNTGLIRGSRGWENRDLTQAASWMYRAGMENNGVGGESNSASGLTLYANHEWFFAALGAWTTGQGAGAAGANVVDVGADMSGIWRFALTPPQIFGFDTMIGGYGVFGSHSMFNDSGSKMDVATQAAGLDFQAQGNITEGITLEIIGNMLLDTDNPSDRNWIERGGEDFKRYQFGFDLGFLNDRLITKFNYLHTTGRGIDATVGSVNWDRKSADIVSLAAYYNIRENVSLRPEISWVVGSDDTYGGTSDSIGQRRSNIGSDTEFILMLMYAF